MQKWSFLPFLPTTNQIGVFVQMKKVIIELFKRLSCNMAAIYATLHLVAAKILQWCDLPIIFGPSSWWLSICDCKSQMSHLSFVTFYNHVSLTIDLLQFFLDFIVLQACYRLIPEMCSNSVNIKRSRGIVLLYRLHLHYILPFQEWRLCYYSHPFSNLQLFYLNRLRFTRTWEESLPYIW